eukprot:gene9555-6711_t
MSSRVGVVLSLFDCWIRDTLIQGIKHELLRKAPREGTIAAKHSRSTLPYGTRISFTGYRCVSVCVVAVESDVPEGLCEGVVSITRILDFLKASATTALWSQGGSYSPPLRLRFAFIIIISSIISIQGTFPAERTISAPLRSMRPASLAQINENTFLLCKPDIEHMHKDVMQMVSQAGFLVQAKSFRMLPEIAAEVAKRFPSVRHRLGSTRSGGAAAGAVAASVTGRGGPPAAASGRPAGQPPPALSPPPTAHEPSARAIMDGAVSATSSHPTSPHPRRTTSAAAPPPCCTPPPNASTPPLSPHTNRTRRLSHSGEAPPLPFAQPPTTHFSGGGPEEEDYNRRRHYRDGVAPPTQPFVAPRRHGGPAPPPHGPVLPPSHVGHGTAAAATRRRVPDPPPSDAGAGGRRHQQLLAEIKRLITRRKEMDTGVNAGLPSSSSTSTSATGTAGSDDSNDDDGEGDGSALDLSSSSSFTDDSSLPLEGGVSVSTGGTEQRHHRRPHQRTHTASLPPPSHSSTQRRSKRRGGGGNKAPPQRAKSSPRVRNGRRHRSGRQRASDAVGSGSDQPVDSAEEEEERAIARGTAARAGISQRERWDSATVLNNRLFESMTYEEFLQAHVDHLSHRGTCLAVLLSAPNAVERLKEMVGPENPVDARRIKPSSLHARLGTDLIRNGVYAAATLSEANALIAVVFGYSPQYRSAGDGGGGGGLLGREDLEGSVGETSTSAASVASFGCKVRPNLSALRLNAAGSATTPGSLNPSVSASAMPNTTVWGGEGAGGTTPRPALHGGVEDGADPLARAQATTVAVQGGTYTHYPGGGSPRSGSPPPVVHPGGGSGGTPGLPHCSSAARLDGHTPVLLGDGGPLLAGAPSSTTAVPAGGAGVGGMRRSFAGTPGAGPAHNAAGSATAVSYGYHAEHSAGNTTSTSAGGQQGAAAGMGNGPAGSSGVWSSGTGASPNGAARAAAAAAAAAADGGKPSTVMVDSVVDERIRRVQHQLDEDREALHLKNGLLRARELDLLLKEQGLRRATRDWTEPARPVLPIAAAALAAAAQRAARGPDLLPYDELSEAGAGFPGLASPGGGQLHPHPVWGLGRGAGSPRLQTEPPGTALPRLSVVGERAGLNSPNAGQLGQHRRFSSMGAGLGGGLVDPTTAMGWVTDLSARYSVDPTGMMSPGAGLASVFHRFSISASGGAAAAGMIDMLCAGVGPNVANPAGHTAARRSIGFNSTVTAGSPGQPGSGVFSTAGPERAAETSRRPFRFTPNPRVATEDLPELVRDVTRRHALFCALDAAGRGYLTREDMLALVLRSPGLYLNSDAEQQAQLLRAVERILDHHTAAAPQGTGTTTTSSSSNPNGLQPPTTGPRGSQTPGAGLSYACMDTSAMTTPSAGAANGNTSSTGTAAGTGTTAPTSPSHFSIGSTGADGSGASHPPPPQGDSAVRAVPAPRAAAPQGEVLLHLIRQ